MIKRLQIKFVCINMVIVTAMLYVIFSLIIFFMGLGMQIQNRGMMQNILENASRLEWGIRERREDWRSFFVVHIDPEGKMVAFEGSFFDGMDEEQIQSLVAAAMSQKGESGTLREQKFRFQKRDAPSGQIIAFSDMSSEIRTLENLTRTCLFIGILSFSLFLGISCLLARWAVKPVETAWNQQRQFVADASHELKTPLTVIMTNAELLRSEDYDDSQVSCLVESILTMSQQMRGLVESLLELARVDNGGMKMVFGELDLSELVLEGLLPFEPIYFEKKLLLESAIEDGIRVKGSNTHLRQVLDILLDNGAKYSNPGGQVMVKLRRQGSSCLLSVADPGAPISREDLRNIFKRFYRIDKARAMNHSYGLGLAIADSIVKAHKGKIWAESENGINTFFVQLPLG